MKEIEGSTRRTLGTALTIAVILLGGSCALTSKEGPVIEPGPNGFKVIESIRIPDVLPHGLVMARQALWTVDTTEKTLNRIDLKAKRVISTVPLRIGEPRGITWDGKTFWIVDNREKAVHQIDPDKGSLLRTIAVPIDFDREKAVLEAAAFDGTHLWVAYFAGWSSRILRIDAETGEVLQSMFAKGHPRALATDGKRLWMVSYNQGRYTGVISERTIMDDADRMNLSIEFLARTPGKEPVGMAYDGRHLWITDREMKTVHKVELP